MYCIHDMKVSALDMDFPSKFCLADMHHQTAETLNIPENLPPEPKRQLFLLLSSSNSKEVKCEQQRMMTLKVKTKQKSM